MTNTTLLENNEIMLQAEDLEKVVGGGSTYRRIVFGNEINKYKGVPGRYYAAKKGNEWFYGELKEIYERPVFLWATTTVWAIKNKYTYSGVGEGEIANLATKDGWKFYEATVYE